MVALKVSKTPGVPNLESKSWLGLHAYSFPIGRLVECTMWWSGGGAVAKVMSGIAVPTTGDDPCTVSVNKTTTRYTFNVTLHSNGLRSLDLSSSQLVLSSFIFK